MLNDDIVFENLEKNDKNTWGLLLATGYVSVVNKRVTEDLIEYQIKIPNVEVLGMFKEMFENWFSQSNTVNMKQMLESLILGEDAVFEEMYTQLVLDMFSTYDTNIKTGEHFYHSFTLGLFAPLNGRYIIDSNRESGYGRYDIMLLPLNENKDPGIIIEFKIFSKNLDKNMEEACNRALKQIEDKNYEAELVKSGVKNCIKVAIAFDGKKVKIKIVR